MPLVPVEPVFSTVSVMKPFVDSHSEFRLSRWTCLQKKLFGSPDWTQRVMKVSALPPAALEMKSRTWIRK